jgi:hypothetical protein
MPQTLNVGSRSLFVTLTAWLFLVLGAVVSAAALLQNALWVSGLAGVPALGAAQSLPLVTGLLLGYLPWVMAIGLALSVATTVSAVGLLLRLEWARRCFIGLLSLAIAANLIGLWLQHEIVQSVFEATLVGSPMPAAAAHVFGGFVTASRAMGAVMTLATCAALGWVIRQLMSPGVRQEFA